MRYIYLCECNSKFYNMNLFQSSMAMTSVCQSQFACTRTVEIQGLCLQLKRSGTEYAGQKINFLTSAVANGRSRPL